MPGSEMSTVVTAAAGCRMTVTGTAPGSVLGAHHMGDHGPDSSSASSTTR
ncbi:hypothetical protein [Streptomyces sp. MH60]|nr:hypothetical protein [Streptomyces sp. MH60]